MRKLISLLLLIGLLPMLMTTGCKKDKETTDFDLMTEYALANDLDLSNLLDGWVIPGTKLNVNTEDFSIPDYYIMDFRKEADFEIGHVKDAHNVTMTNVLVEAEKAAGKKILCICYTGQTAARATGFLRMAGYSAKSLKWGMSSWNPIFEGKWESNAKDITSPSWELTGSPQSITEFSTPTFTTGKATGKEIFESRLKTAIGLNWVILNTDVLASPENYFINNKWPQASWDEYGHIKGAFRVNEDLNINGLKNIDPNENLVTYCYTGQTSSIITSWLQVMGYDKARSLKFGANGIIHSKLLAGASGSAPKKSWKGPSSGSVLNFGYYDGDGLFHNP